MLAALHELEKLGYVRVVHHHTLPLAVYNYTPVVQFDNLWGQYPLLLMCRGLVVDDDGQIQGRGFDKFFNWEQLPPEKLPVGATDIEISTKMDGSMILVFRYEGQLVFTTRGSFYSDQSQAAERLFYSLYDELLIENGKSYLFEFIGPENRIVVSYPDMDLVLLAVLDTETGIDLPRTDGFKHVFVHTVHGAVFGPALYHQLKSLDTPNEEGFVIKINHGPGSKPMRLKLKYETYIKLHRIVTGVSNKTLWEMLRDGRPIEELLEYTPDEFNDFVRGIVAELQSKYDELDAMVEYAYNKVKNLPTRKEQALAIMTDYKTVSSAVFSKLDGADYSKSLWGILKPTRYIQPFETRGDM